ncbi:MAG TPA: deoxyribonuclease IV [Acidimicrobiales bacterium]|nr:deoxyribonuclease IV [Acidimicrobiales bacterium]
MNIGAHVRGGGKLVPSLELGVEMGATSIQIFTQSPRMWKPSQYAPDVLAAYREAAANTPSITDTFCHATYLINLATGDRDLYDKSVACLIHNLSVARGIGSSGLVLHVGSHQGAGFDTVVRQIADAFERAFVEADPSPEGVAECPILIENAAGIDGPVGRTLEEIHMMIDACNNDDRLGLCIDTQHLWASGFDYSSRAGADRLIKEIEMSVGIGRLRCFHLNDSKIELGGNRDRHANIGEGTIGTRGLATLLGQPLIRNLPLILEVPGNGDGPRAEDVTVARQVLIAGIALYDGDQAWADLLPDVTVMTPMVPVAKGVVKKAAAPAKKTAPTAAKSAKKTLKKAATATKKAGKKVVAKKTAPTAAKKTSKKTAKKSAKKAAKAAKKTARSAAKKTAKATSKKVAKKAPTKVTAKKKPSATLTKSAKKRAEKSVNKKSPKKSAKKSSKKSAKKSRKK